MNVPNFQIHTIKAVVIGHLPYHQQLSYCGLHVYAVLIFKKKIRCSLHFSTRFCAILQFYAPSQTVMHFITLLLTATLNYSSQTLIKNFRIVNVKGQENQLLQVNIHCYLKVVGLIVKYNYTLNMKPKNPHLTTTGSNKSNIGCKKKYIWLTL